MTRTRPADRRRWRLVALCALGIITGCSAPQAAPGAESATSSSLRPNADSSETPAIGVSTTASERSTPDTETDTSATLTPPVGVEVSPTPIPDGEALANYLKDKAMENQLTDPPSVPIVRRISPDDLRSVTIKCLEDAGFPVTENGPYAIAPNYPPEQADAYHLAAYICAAQYPLENKYLQDPGLSYYVNFYHYEVDVTVPCLEAQGYPQTEPVPTLQTYLSELGTAQEWHAINVISGVPPPKLYDLQEACPQLPPIDTLLEPAH